MNNRIKKLRSTLKMTQEDLGKWLGITKSGVSEIEAGRRKVTEQHIIMLVNHGVNEQWIRTGEEPMMIEATTFSLDEFITKQGGTELEKEIIRTYFELPEDIRKTILEHFKQKFGLQEKLKEKSMTVAEMQTLYDSIPDTPMELERLGKDDINNAV